MSAFIRGMWEKSHHGSNWNVTVFLYISAAYEESHYSQLVFPGASLILLSVRTYRGPGGEQQERPISVIEATASSAARQENRRSQHVVDETEGKCNKNFVGQATAVKSK